mgnify:CR=1 FL=1
MKFEIAPKPFLEALNRLLPHKRGLLRKGPLVTLNAEDGALDVIGEFENTWSIAAKVKSEGRCTVDLITLIAKLKTYDQKTPIGFVLHEEGLRFGTTRLALHQER